MPFCKKCGSKLDDDAVFCGECGAPVTKTKSSTQAPTSPPPDPADDDFRTVVRSAPSYAALNLENLPAGHVIDERYEIGSKLGQGGFGAVYLAYDRKMKIDKALKVFPQAIVNDLEAMRNLQEEAGTMVRLNHPNIVRVYDFHEGKQISYIDMEYVPGWNLTEVKLSRPGKRLPAEEARICALQIAEGLAYAHSQRVIHRDVKPQNILVTQEGRAKIMDFGIAETVRTSVSRVAHSSSSGTLVYMAPEAVLGENVGNEADIYSFGAMLYELLTGNPPFNRGDISYQILNKPPSPIPDAPAEMNALVMKCLAKDYRQRHRSFEEVARALKGGTGGVAPAKAGSTTSPVERHAGADTSGGGTHAASSPRTEPSAAVKNMAGLAKLSEEDVSFVAALLKGLVNAFGGAGKAKDDAIGFDKLTGQRRRFPLGKIAVAVVVLVALVIAGFLLCQPPRGMLHVVVEPGDARILLDGEDCGMGRLYGEVKAGSYRLRVEAEGYVAREDRIVVERNQEMYERVVLRELTGALSITSAPSGAQVLVDGKDTGKRTPTVVEALARGTHEVRVCLRGVCRVRSNVKVGAGETETMHFNLADHIARKDRRGSGAGTGSGKAVRDSKKQGTLKISRPKFTKGGALTGARSKVSIMRVVMENLASLRYAYNKCLDRRPGLKGKITVKFAIDEFGKVIFCKVIGNTMEDEPLEAEIVAKIRRWDFEKIDKPGDVTEVIYPFVFSK